VNTNIDRKLWLVEKVGCFAPVKVGWGDMSPK